jgi:hypothetical protein
MAWGQLLRSDSMVRVGPYLSERAWGTVREDYSDNGDAWSFFHMIMHCPGPTGGTKTAC